jgi:hypothetical protein
MLYIIKTFFEITIFSHSEKKKKNVKNKYFFFINISKIFTTRKKLKMENKHPENFWSA